MVFRISRSSSKPARKRSVSAVTPAAMPMSAGSAAARGLEDVEHGLAPALDLLQQVRLRLVEVAMDQALQAHGLALERHQQPIRLARLAQIVPGRGQAPGAVPDQRGEQQHHGGIETGDRHDAPADRQRADALLEPAPAVLQGRRPRRRRLPFARVRPLAAHCVWRMRSTSSRSSGLPASALS